MNKWGRVIEHLRRLDDQGDSYWLHVRTIDGFTYQGPCIRWQMPDQLIEIDHIDAETGKPKNCQWLYIDPAQVVAIEVEEL